METTSGIYRITSGEDTLYVGQSKNVIKRIKDHQRQLNAGKHPNRLLQRRYDFNPDFNYECLEIVPDVGNALLEQEQWAHNLYLPLMAEDVPCLALATDKFKLHIFSKVLGQARRARFR